MISLGLAARSLAAVTLLAAIAAAGGLGWMPRLLGRGVAVQGGASAGIARRLIVYRLDPVRPTVFRFTQPVRQTRIIAHPILAAGSAKKGEGWTYAVRAELLDAQGQVLASREIHSLTALLRSDGTRSGPLQFYRGSNELVAHSDEVRIAAALPFAALRLTAPKSRGNPVAVDVRVSERRPLLDSTAASAFRRYSPDDKRRLASPNAFPAELLTPQERASIAINQWRPVGPAGIDGRDYRMRVLYEEQSDSETSDEPDAEPEAGE